MGMVSNEPETEATVRSIAAEGYSSVTAVSLSPDGKSLANIQGERAPFIKLWDLRTGKVVRRLIHPQADVIDCLAFSPDGTSILTGGGGQFEEYQLFCMMRMWDVASGAIKWTRAAAAETFNPLVLSDNGRFVIAGFPTLKGIAFWNLRDGKIEPTNQSESQAAIFAPDNKAVALAGSLTRFNSGVSLRNATTGSLLKTFKASSEGIDSIAFSTDGKTIAAGSEAIRVWDVATGKLVRALHRPAMALAFSPDGQFLVSMGLTDTSNSGALSLLTLWNCRTGKSIWTRKDARYALGSVYFSPDGHELAVIGQDGNIGLVSTVSGQSMSLGNAAVEQQDECFTSVAFSPDGKTLAALEAYGFLFRWDLASGKLNITGKGLYLEEYVPVPGSNQKLLVNGSESVLNFWDLECGHLLLTIELFRLNPHNPAEPLTWIAYTPSGDYDCTPGARIYPLARRGPIVSGGEI